MKLDELQRWERSLVDEVEALRKRRADLDAEIQQRSKKLELVRQMVTLEAGASAAVAIQASGGMEARATPDGVRDAAAIILTDAAQPLHINDIHRQFLDRGFSIPGGGTPFNILVHLVKSPRFVRVARGTYALAGTVPDAQVLPTQPRRPKRRKNGRTQRAKG
jgi:hypothetical protein